MGQTLIGGRFRWSGLRKSPYTARPSATSGWPPALEAGQELELAQGLKNGQLYFEARYQVEAPTRAAAKKAARALSRDLQFSLAAALSSYSFTPAEASAADSYSDWPLEYCFRPEACRVVVGRAVGLARGSSEIKAVQLPVIRPRITSDFLRELMHLIGASSTEFEVTVRLTPFPLEDDPVLALGAALGSLYSPGRLLTEDDRSWPGDNQAVITGLVSLLERWLERRSGHKTLLMVRTRSAPSAALLQAVSNAVLHGSSGRWERMTDAGFHPDARLLDLLDCRPLGLPAPAIAPPPDYFAAAGHPEIAAPHPGSLSRTGILLGHSSDGRRTEPVRFADSDRTRHCYVIGATGTGKSTLLFNMVLQDIRAGAGVCVLDPHGDLQDDLLQAVPSSRCSDIIAVDLADPDRAIGLNLLESRGRHSVQQVSFAINEILSMFWMLYGTVPESMGPAFEQYMRNTLMVLAQKANGPGTIADVMRFYEDSAFRNAALDACTNSAASAFFRGIANKATGDTSLVNVAQYITNKLNRFVGSDFVRPIIAQSASTLDFRHCMDSGKVLLFNLNKGLLGETECRLVGMMILAKLFAAALDRSREPRSTRRTFHLYVDEAQIFTTPIVGSILAEARKFGLTMTLANQNLAQWDADGGRGLLQSILGNVGTLLMFRVGPEDADRLATFTKPEFSARDLQYLPDRMVLAKLLAEGRPVPPFTMQTAAPLIEPDGSHADELMAVRLRRNFEKHSRPRAEIEAEWLESHREALVNASIAKQPP